MQDQRHEESTPIDDASEGALANEIAKDLEANSNEVVGGRVQGVPEEEEVGH